MSDKRILVALYLFLLVLMLAVFLYGMSLSYQQHIWLIFNYSANITNLTRSSSSTAASTYTSAKTTLYSSVPQFVSFHDGFADGRRLGNQIFNLAAVIFVAELTSRTPVIDKNLHLSLEDVFQLNLDRVNIQCPCHIIDEQRHLSYDVNTEQLDVNNTNIGNRFILVKGYRQSWKYTLAIERRLRSHLVFKEEIQRFAESFLKENIPRGWKRAGFARVGIHIRRGDYLKPSSLKGGYTVPNETYFLKAMKYFTDRYSRVQFITVSDDWKWTREHIISRNSSSAAINITHSSGNTAGQDLALISMCEHVIMSVGTFGWWAGWLAKGITVYYSDWPRNGSGLADEFSQEDFFFPYWIPMTSD